MKTIVAGAQARRGLDPERRVGAQPAGLSVEPHLPNRIGARALPQWFQDIIVEAGDVRHEGKLVGGVRLDGVGTSRACARDTSSRDMALPEPCTPGHP
jgi:hypothetical protein